MERSESSNLTKLPQEYTFWFTFFKKSKDKQLEEFEDNLKEIGSFGTAEEFWGIYQHMKRPNSLPRGCEFFLFKKGIRPLWEDPANQGGGRFFISVKKNQANNKLWEDLLISTLMLKKDMDAVNGIVLNVRTYEVFISLWTKQLDEEQTLNIKNWMRTSMELPLDILIEYKLHPTTDDLMLKQEQLLKEETERKRRFTEVDKKKDEGKDEGRLRVNSENLDLKRPREENTKKPVVEHVSEGEEEAENNLADEKKIQTEEGNKLDDAKENQPSKDQSNN